MTFFQLLQTVKPQMFLSFLSPSNKTSSECEDTSVRCIYIFTHIKNWFKFDSVNELLLVKCISIVLMHVVVFFLRTAIFVLKMTNILTFYAIVLSPNVIPDVDTDLNTNSG